MLLSYLITLSVWSYAAEYSDDLVVNKYASQDGNTDTNKYGQEIALTLNINQTILLALGKNYGVKLNRLSNQLSKWDIEIEEGAFEPSISASYLLRNLHSIDIDIDSQQITARNQIKTAEIGLNGYTPWGTSYSISFDSNSTKVNSTEVSQTSSFSSTIQVTQPLLQGAGKRAVYAGVRLAKNRDEISSLIFRQQILSFVSQVINAYTDCYAAKLALDVGRENHLLAQKTLDNQNKRVALGNSAQFDTLRPAASVISREEAILNAEKRLRRAENRLKMLIADDAEELFALKLQLKALPQTEFLLPNVYADFKQALLLRPDYKLSKLNINGYEIELARDRQRLLPKLDLVMRHQQFGQVNGLAVSDAYSSYRHLGAKDNYIGLEFSMPLSRKILKGRVAKTALALERQKLDATQIKQHILFELDTSAFDMQHDWQRIDVTNQSAELAQQALTAEQKKMAVGRSTNFYILDLQNRLANAKNQQVNAYASYYQALTEYQRQKGTLLDVYDIQLSDFTSGIPLN